MQELSIFWSEAVEKMGRINFANWGQSAPQWDKLQQRPFSELLATKRSTQATCTVRHIEPIRTKWSAVTLADDVYPERLRHISYPPPVLFFEGNLACLEASTIGIVGTRRCSTQGRTLSYRFASRLADAGFTIVSGLAFGIDTYAHRGAVAQGRTVAVLAHGLSHTAPRSNARLRTQILENDGLILTAWPDDVPPRPFRFPIRNRWIAGLSDQLLVVEAPAHSGAIGTAQFANEFGRPVWAVPGGVSEPWSAGCNRLIADGAGVIWDVDAAIEYWSGVRGPSVEEWLSWVYSGMSLEAVAKKTGKSVVQLLATLSRMEVEGTVIRLDGHQYIEGKR